ncbi:MAG: metalloregulator ArsR/SmtB family transcription factor [bacterium]|nr:metalloregulator ArsR/SmtB family transcription factor [bacterium]
MSEQEHATRLLQALADPTRLRLVAALLEQPACVEELAERLGLSAPTISHHLGKLDQAGLLNRRREQYYTVCEARPGPLARTLRELVATAADQPGAEEARQHLLRQRLLATFFDNGRLRQLPAQRKKRRVVLAAFAADFAVDRDYAEPEVNEIIARRFADYCTIRRELVDDRLLSRAKTSGQLLQYRRTGDVPVAALPWPVGGGDSRGADDGAGITRMKGTEPMTDSDNQDIATSATGASRLDLRRRKEWMELYKQARKAAGIYAVRNTATGRVLLGSSVNLHGPLNRHRTELKLGSHRCTELQADWNRLGQDAFVFEILDKVPDELAGLERDGALRQLELKWLAEYPPSSERCYNTSGKIRVRQF